MTPCRRLDVSYDIAMTLCVYWVGGISSKTFFLLLKNEVQYNYRSSKTLENTYEEVQFSEV